VATQLIPIVFPDPTARYALAIRQGPGSAAPHYRFADGTWQGAFTAPDCVLEIYPLEAAPSPYCRVRVAVVPLFSPAPPAGAVVARLRYDAQAGAWEPDAVDTL